MKGADAAAVFGELRGAQETVLMAGRVPTAPTSSRLELKPASRRRPLFANRSRYALPTPTDARAIRQRFYFPAARQGALATGNRIDAVEALQIITAGHALTLQSRIDGGRRSVRLGPDSRRVQVPQAIVGRRRPLASRRKHRATDPLVGCTRGAGIRFFATFELAAARGGSQPAGS